MLKGNKVTLRPYRRSDVDYLMLWFNDTEFMQYTGKYLPMTEKDVEKWVEAASGNNARVDFVIEANLPGANKTIGRLGIFKINSKDREATFGIGIGDKGYWSHGYGTEAATLCLKYAFETLNLHRITSEVFSFNERSQKMHLKIGFKEEGRKRSLEFINGQYWDVIVYGILESEWRDFNKG